MMLSRVADSLYWMSRYIERAEHRTPPPPGARVEALTGEEFAPKAQDAFAITRAGLRPRQ
jgi:hypothetical protein